jgi:hypothetical protein
MADNIHYLTRGGRKQVGSVSVQGMGSAPIPTINIGSSKFTLTDAANNEMAVPTMGPIFVEADGRPKEGSPVGPYLDAVLVDVNEIMSKSFWGSAYQNIDGPLPPPKCWSDNGEGPSVNASNPVSFRCDTCPNNVWGSQINNLGNKVKACEDIRKMTWIVPDLWRQGMKTIFLLRLKGGSFRNWRAYYETVTRNRIGDRPMDPTDLVTRIYFDPDTQGKTGILKFYAVSLVDEATAKAQDWIWQEHATDTLLGRQDVPIDRMPVSQGQAPQQVQPPRQPEPQPAPIGQWVPQGATPPATVSQDVAQPRRRGRRPKDETPAQTPTNVPQQQPTAPPAPQAAPFAPPPPPQQAPTQFGMRAPAAPTPDVAEAIARSLNLPGVPPPR